MPRQKSQETRARIVAAAAKRLRTEGLGATGVDKVMKDAGLTHGGFYAHFKSKDALIAEGLAAAAAEARESWFAGLGALAPEARLAQTAGRYLSARHRDRAETGCAFAALATEIARADPTTRGAFEREFRLTVARLSEETGQGEESAFALLALAVGALALSRAVADPELSDAILYAARRAAIMPRRSGRP